jgi:endonuclease/exonuclease/phosphatase family metal-dependent hydrolase
MAAISSRLLELDAHVVALQEVWTFDARDSLLKAGRRAGYDHVWHNPEATGGSGLLLLSRLEILDASFTPFLVRGKPERLDHADYYSGKGFAVVRVKTDSGPVGVLNTHVHARYSDHGTDEYLEARVAQVVQICAGVRSVSDPLIALGDFNLVESGPEYRILRSFCGWTDLGVRFGERQHTSAITNPYRDDPGDRIDYVFCRNGDERAIRGLLIRREFDEPLEIEGQPLAYSDHFGLLAELELAGRASSQTATEPDPEVVQLAGDFLAEGERVTLRRERRQQLAAVGAGTVSLGAWLASGKLTRRSWLLATARAVAVAGAASMGGLAWLALDPTPAEVLAYQEVERQLAALAAPQR